MQEAGGIPVAGKAENSGGQARLAGNPVTATLWRCHRGQAIGSPEPPFSPLQCGTPTLYLAGLFVWMGEMCVEPPVSYSCEECLPRVPLTVPIF